MKKAVQIVLCVLMGGIPASEACTNLIVGRGASVDGSVFVSYSADSYGCCGIMRYYAGGTHNKGEMRKIYDWESNLYRGEIPEAGETYNVVGNINEYQLCIAETTFGGREELVDTAGIDYGSLIYLALQRCKTAREAIKTMTELVGLYGYCSEGESFTIADKNEAWIMEMVGKAGTSKGAVWVAVRIPDDCIAAHANQARIHKFMQYDKADCLYADDVVDFARSQGYYSGSDEDFDFADAYCPLNFSGARICEARVWSFFKNHMEDMDKYYSYVSGEDLDAEPMPLFVRPVRKLSLQDIQHDMRDHFEGTPLEMANDRGAGAYGMPYRATPLTWDLDGKTYFNERPTSTQQASFTFVAQMRSELPDAVGGIIWWGSDDANMIPYTPVYCCALQAPDCYGEKYADDVKFSFESAFWVQNWVSNMVYSRYSLMMPDVSLQRDRLDSLFYVRQAEIEAHASDLLTDDKDAAVSYLTEYSLGCADTMMTVWKDLALRLIVKYNDFIIHPEKDGEFLRTPEGRGVTVERPGYDEAVKRSIIEQTQERYLVPTNE